ncbi:MAG: long-chain fatty acid--CoA ligase, partial [Haloferacaceae archaeon]
GDGATAGGGGATTEGDGATEGGATTEGDGATEGGTTTEGDGATEGGTTAEGDIEVGDLSVYSLGEVYERGAADFDPGAYESWLDARDPDDLATLVYTSGTTGRRKGVRLTHRNLGSNVTQCARRFGPRSDRPAAGTLDHTAVSLSVLPLSHVFERLVGHYLLFAVGGCVSYAESPSTLREDLTAVRPTVLTGVPRLYEKLFEGLREGAGEGARGRLFEWAVDVAREYDAADDPGLRLRTRHALADRLVFSAVRTALGGRLAFPISGGSSLPEPLARRYRGMGVPVLEGYGLTETAPVVAVNPPGASRPGTVGPALAGVETRLDTDVDASMRPVDGGEVGELLVRGPNVTEGYWNRPEATAGAFVRAEDGSEVDPEHGRKVDREHGSEDDREAGPWFRTGDVVERRPDGYLRFRGRRKEVLALSTGKKVAPAPIEAALVECDPVEQALVLGDERKFVAALIVPATTGATGRTASEGVDRPAGPGGRAADDRLRERVARAVACVNETLEPHERIERFRLVDRAFTEADGLLTPTLKKRRHEIRERYADVVAGLYEDATSHG